MASTSQQVCLQASSPYNILRAYEHWGSPVTHTHVQSVETSLHPHAERFVAISAVVVYIDAPQVNERPTYTPMVARVSIVDYCGGIVLDTYVRPTHIVGDFRTAETGLQSIHLANAPHFDDVQLRVASIIKNKIIIGHSLWNTLSVMGLSHPALHTRDLALFRPLRKKLKSRSMIDLKTLVRLFMGRDIGFEYEDSVEIARGSLDLFHFCEELFEQIILEGAWPCNLPPSAFAQYFT